MKKFLNNVEDIMQETLEGYARANQHYLSLKEGTHNITRKIPKEQGKVKLVIGNGGGHEPGTPGQVGYGLYDLVLLTIANHAGDVMNGNLACRKAKAAGIQIESVVHYDDVATAPKGCEEERRGVTGIFFPTKVAGTAAEEGASLETCVELFNETRDRTRSVSIALGGGTHPQTGLAMMDLPDDVANIGTGSHGEGGAKNIPFASS